MGCIYRRKRKLPDGTSVEVGPFWLKWYENGKPHSESSGSYKETEAKRLLKKREGAVANGEIVNPRLERIRIGELLDDVLLDYRTNGKAVRFAKNAIDNHLRPFFAQKFAAKLTTPDVQQYIYFRRSTDQGSRVYRGRRAEPKSIPIRPASNATINRELALLKRAFHLGAIATPRKVGAIPHIPLLKEDNVRKGFFEHDQFIALRAALPEDLRAPLTFAYFTGCRRGEILSLRWGQVDLANRMVRLEPGTTKNKEARELPLTGELFEVLSMQASIREVKCPNCPFVFFREGGKPVRSFRRAWASACKKVGLIGEDGDPNRLFHDLRRSGVRNLIRSGVPEVVAMAISGHRTRSVFDRYNIVNQADLKDAARKLENYLSGQTPERASEKAPKKPVSKKAVTISVTNPVGRG